MPRSAPRRPTPISLPKCPMDTLWEVDESSPEIEATHQFEVSSRRPSQASSWFASPPASGPLRSIFEDDDDEEEEEDDDLRFPLPPLSLPTPTKRMSITPQKSMTLPIQSIPRSQRTPSPTNSMTPSPRSSSLYAPRRASVSVSFPRERTPTPAAPVTPPRRQRVEVQRPVSPTSSASSSDTEPPRTPPAASTCLPSSKPIRILPPTEWESAIDALFASDDEDDEDEQPVFVQPKTNKRPPMPTRPPPPPPRSRARARSPDQTQSYLSWSPVSSPGPMSPSHLPMSPMYGRALASPGFMPMSPTESSDHGHSYIRPARSSRRITS